MKKYESFIKDNITIPDVAWLYMLKLYNGKMDIKSWKNDNRMGVNFITALNKFDCVTKDNEYYYSTPECDNILHKYFGAKTFEETISKKSELKQYDIPGLYGYTISRTPYDLYMLNHPKLRENFDRIENRIRDHYNSQESNDKIIAKLSKSKDLKYWNFKNLYEMFDGKIPKIITLYRGLKQEYKTDYYTTYSCWTTSKTQGERFAKYYFTGGYQFKPLVSEIQTLMIAEVTIDEILIVIGGDESEVIMKNPVQIKEIINLKE
jgi:hypothetical protein